MRSSRPPLGPSARRRARRRRDGAAGLQRSGGLRERGLEHRAAAAPSKGPAVQRRERGGRLEGRGRSRESSVRPARRAARTAGRARGSARAPTRRRPTRHGVERVLDDAGAASGRAGGDRLALVAGRPAPRLRRSRGERAAHDPPPTTATSGARSRRARERDLGLREPPMRRPRPPASTATTTCRAGPGAMVAAGGQGRSDVPGSLATIVASELGSVSMSERPGSSSSPTRPPRRRR